MASDQNWLGKWRSLVAAPATPPNWAHACRGGGAGWAPGPDRAYRPGFPPGPDPEAPQTGSPAAPLLLHEGELGFGFPGPSLPHAVPGKHARLAAAAAASRDTRAQRLGARTAGDTAWNVITA